MSEPDFFPPAAAIGLEEAARIAGARLARAPRSDAVIRGAAPLDAAGPDQLTFFENRRYLADLDATRAAACLCRPRDAARVPAAVAVLECADPYRAFATILAHLYPAARRPLAVWGEPGIAQGAIVHPTAQLEAGVTVEPTAVIGPYARIGAGTVICAGAAIGAKVCIGRDSYVGPGASVLNALVGDRVFIHGGARIGQDGFGFAMGPDGHAKVPQIGRVVIQDDVEIGANTTIDRGALRDTVIGEGTKIDNLVQIAHNVVIGRHCVIVSQAGISGSTKLGDFVALGGQAGLSGHLTIGSGAQVAGQAGVQRDVPAGERWIGAPARPLRQFGRELAALRRLAGRGDAGEDA